jgi:hypothetical protein
VIKELSFCASGRKDLEMLNFSRPWWSLLPIREGEGYCL